MEKQEIGNWVKPFHFSKIENGKKLKNKFKRELKLSQKSPLPPVSKFVIYKAYGWKVFTAGFFVCLCAKPSIIENIFTIFDFSTRKKDKTETRNIKYPKEDFGNLVHTIEDQDNYSFDLITDDKPIYYDDLIKFERKFESDINSAKSDLLLKILEKEFKSLNFDKEIKIFSQDYFKESEMLKNILKSIKKSEVSNEEYEKISVILDLAENNSKSFFKNLKSNNISGKSSNQKIDLFAYNSSKSGKYSEAELSEFIGKLNNNKIIKQYYLVENLKSKINNIFNENIEDRVNKEESHKLVKKYETILQVYQTNKSQLMNEYINNYKDIDLVEDAEEIKLYYNLDSQKLNIYLKNYYEKYMLLIQELAKKNGQTNNVENIIKYNKDFKNIISRFERLAFNFRDVFIQKALEKIRISNLKIHSEIEINNEFEKIKLDLIEKINKDLPKKAWNSFFINKFYNNVILSNFKEMPSLLYFWFNPYCDIDKVSTGYKQEYTAFGVLNEAIKLHEYERAYECLKYLSKYRHVTQNLEKKLSNQIKKDLICSLLSEHAKI